MSRPLKELSISDEDVQFFQENGFLIVRGALRGAELARLRAAMAELVAEGVKNAHADSDFLYGVGHKTGDKVLRRIEYVIDKRPECCVLLGNPFILRSVEQLIGADLIPTWDSMVVKMPGEGIVVPWHRDADDTRVGDMPIFNVDFYLDEATAENCVWVIPGSHAWGQAQADEEVKRRADSTFTTEGAAPALMQPGDVLFHNILLVHGSPPSASAEIRRVIYYEFRAAHVEAALGPHVPGYIPLKQKVLLACIAERQRADYIPADEEPYVYVPPAPYDQVRLEPGERLPTYRYTHGEYWRT